MNRRQITEYLEIDLADEHWYCRRCGHRLGPARQNYKTFCLVYDRDPRTVHPPHIEGRWALAPNPDWCRILEFYCPGCGAQVEVEYLPPGHPITWDLQLDLDALKANGKGGAGG